MNRLLLLSVLLVTLVFPAAASAGRSQESTFQDDGELIYTSRPDRAKTLDTLKRLGVDRIRVSVIWAALAPNSDSRDRPDADLRDPDAYGDAAWFNYDDVVRMAQERGIKVNLNVTGPSPLWANRRPADRRIADTFEPDPGEWAQFVGAVGQRYSGDWTTDDGKSIPRVSYWSIWNEPNHSGWLTPTWSRVDGVWIPRVAALYRELLDNAYIALGVTGHGKDTIILGETAPTGNPSKGAKRFMRPLTFVRALYCLNGNDKRLSGRAARRLGCPKTGREMVTRHPALFKASGFAHHPYTGTFPDVRPSAPDSVTIGSLKRLTRTLDTALRRYGQRRRLPIYLTEFGYQTSPPQPAGGVSLRNQAAFINQSEYIAFKNRRVRTIGQFLLLDDTLSNSANFQSGLILRKGRKQKPSFDAYRLPIWLQGEGARKELFGVLRPAKNGTRARAKLQFRPRGGSWRTLKTVRSRGRYNTISQRVRLPAPGRVRLAYKGHHSRAAVVK